MRDVAKGWLCVSASDVGDVSRRSNQSITLFSPFVTTFCVASSQTTALSCNAAGSVGTVVASFMSRTAAPPSTTTSPAMFSDGAVSVSVPSPRLRYTPPFAKPTIFVSFATSTIRVTR